MYSYDWKPEEMEVPEIDSSGAAVKNEDGSVKTKKIEPVFSGIVKCNIPKHGDRMKFVNTISSEINQEGELTEAKGVDKGQMMIDFAMKHIKEVNLVRKEDGFIFNKIEMLEYDIDGANILMQIAGKLSQGIHLGKP